MEVIETGEHLGPYRLLTRIGEGGMGVVHLALDPEGRAVAVKVLRPHLVADENGRRRLAREVAALRRVVGPHVAHVLDADVAGPAPYVVMRYVQGRSLPQRVSRSGALHGEELHGLVVGLARALDSIHSVGVVHRDVKPANVLLADGEPVVVDFGLAQFADDTRMTATGMLLGTPGYLAPEAVSGAPTDASADVHGWGTTCAFAATGRPPFGTGPFEVVLGRVLQGRADLEGAPDWLLPLLGWALEHEPADRPTSAELLAALGERSSAVTPRPSRPAPPPHPPAADTVPVPREAPLTRVLERLDRADAPRPLPVQEAPTGPTRRIAELDRRLDELHRLEGPHTEGPTTGNGGEPALHAHPVVLLAVLVVLVAAACLAPGVAAAAALVGSMLLRTLEAAAGYLARRRSGYGRRRTDAVMALAALPWQAVRGAARTLLSLPQALLGALAPGAVVLATTDGLRPRADARAFDLLVAACGAGALLATAYGPGSAPLRRGVDRISGVLLPGRLLPALAVLALLSAAAISVAVALDGRPSSWPMSHLPAPVSGWVDDVRAW